MRLLVESLLSVVILGILFSLLNPAHLLMPDTVNTMLLLALVVGFLTFVGLVWRERASDERELIHILKTGRLSFFVGAAVLVMGVVVQASMHSVDPWLVYALVAMVLTKLATRLFQHFRN